MTIVRPGPSQREQLGALLIALRDGLAADTERACGTVAEPEPEAAPAISN
jgi:hypothetical protein